MHYQVSTLSEFRMIYARHKHQAIVLKLEQLHFARNERVKIFAFA